MKEYMYFVLMMVIIVAFTVLAGCMAPKLNKAEVPRYLEIVGERAYTNVNTVYRFITCEQAGCTESNHIWAHTVPASVTNVITTYLLGTNSVVLFPVEGVRK